VRPRCARQGQRPTQIGYSTFCSPEAQALLSAGRPPALWRRHDSPVGELVRTFGPGREELHFRDRPVDRYGISLRSRGTDSFARARKPHPGPCQSDELAKRRSSAPCHAPRRARRCRNRNGGEGRFRSGARLTRRSAALFPPDVCFGAGCPPEGLISRRLSSPCYGGPANRLRVQLFESLFG